MRKHRPSASVPTFGRGRLLAAGGAIRTGTGGAAGRRPPNPNRVPRRVSGSGKIAPSTGSGSASVTSMSTWKSSWGGSSYHTDGAPSMGSTSDIGPSTLSPGMRASRGDVGVTDDCRVVSSGVLIDRPNPLKWSSIVLRGAPKRSAPRTPLSGGTVQVSSGSFADVQQPVQGSLASWGS